MTDERTADGVRRVLALLSSHLERHLEGEALALDALPAALQDPGVGVDDLLGALWILRSIEHLTASGVPVAPDLLSDGARVTGARGQRMPSAEEREFLGADAWGYLLDLRRRGTLDAAQLEEVLDLLAGSGARPVSLALAREAAASVVLDLNAVPSLEGPYGDLEVAH